MSKLSVDLAADIMEWLEARAAEFGYTPSEMIEHILALESGLRNSDSKGRTLGLRDTIYRQLTAPDVAKMS